MTSSTVAAPQVAPIPITSDMTIMLTLMKLFIGCPPVGVAMSVSDLELLNFEPLNDHCSIVSANFPDGSLTLVYLSSK